MSTRQGDATREPAFAPYRRRPIKFLELWRTNGWQLKVYGISAQAETATPGLVDLAVLENAKAVAARTAFADPPQGDAHGPGFMVVHQGRLANWLLLDWWVNEIWLYHQLYRSPSGGPADFARVDSDLVAWELKVVEFERAAWIKTMLEPANGPDLEAYLGTRLTALV